MKKSLLWVIILAISISMVAGYSLIGCKTTTTETTAAETTAAESTAAETTAAEDFSETGVLKVVWQSSVTTDSIFEPSWKNRNNLYHDMVFDSLVKIDTDGKAVLPSLASLEISPDGKTYTFTLNENAKWHDGTPFTADDVLFSFNTVFKDPESGLGAAMKSIEGAQDLIDGKAETLSGVTADGNKVTVMLSQADSNFVKTVALFIILPAHLLKDVDPLLISKDEAFWKKPVGTGPYYIDEVSFSNFFTLLRNDDYFGKKANIKKVLFTSYDVGGAEAITTAAIAGELDYLFGGTVNDITVANNIVEANKDMKMILVPSTYLRSLWVNNAGGKDYNKDIQKAEVRQALNLLIDKQAIAEFYGGQATALTTYVNPADFRYNSDIPLFERDVEKAKELLAAADFDFDKPIRIAYYYEDQKTKDIMDLLVQNFADGGVKLETSLEVGANQNEVLYETKPYEMMYAGQGGTDPILIYKQLIPDNGLVDGIFGAVETRNEVFVPLLAQYAATNDPAEAKTLGDQIQVEANKYLFALPVYVLNKIILYNTARLKLDESLFNVDLEMMRDMKFDTWELLK